MVIIGIDPHKGSPTAVAIDQSELKLDEVCVRADRRQLERLTTWATSFPERSWAIESANGLGGSSVTAACRHRREGLRRPSDAVGPGEGAGIGQVPEERSQRCVLGRRCRTPFATASVGGHRRPRRRAAASVEPAQEPDVAPHPGGVSPPRSVGWHRPWWDPSSAVLRQGRRCALGLPGKDSRGEGAQGPGPDPGGRCPSSRRAAQSVHTHDRRGGSGGAHHSRRAVRGEPGGHLHHPGPHR